jgi:ATP-dependent protease ClpP protease subunit
MKPNRILARAGKTPATGELLLYGDVGPSEWGMIDDKVFAEELKKLGEVKTIALRIDSPGGSAFTGISIYNQLQRHPARIEVTVDGIAASIASIIAMAGDEIVMGEGAQMMIHEASTLAWGNAAEMEKTASLLHAISGDLAGIYARRTGRAAGELRALMRDETWFTAEKAVEAGFADRVVASVQAKAHLEPAVAARFRHPPKNLLQARETVEASRIRRTVEETVQSVAARAAVYRKEH